MCDLTGSGAWRVGVHPRWTGGSASNALRSPVMPLSPIQAAVDVLGRADQLLAAAGSIADPLVADDMRRFALAQGVAALDTYLHWAIADAPLEEMPSALKS